MSFHGPLCTTNIFPFFCSWLLSFHGLSAKFASFCYSSHGANGISTSKWWRKKDDWWIQLKQYCVPNVSKMLVTWASFLQYPLREQEEALHYLWRHQFSEMLIHGLTSYFILYRKISDIFKHKSQKICA